MGVGVHDSGPRGCGGGRLRRGPLCVRQLPSTEQVVPARHDFAVAPIQHDVRFCAEWRPPERHS